MKNLTWISEMKKDFPFNRKWKPSVEVLWKLLSVCSQMFKRFCLSRKERKNTRFDPELKAVFSCHISSALVNNFKLYLSSSPVNMSTFPLMTTQYTLLHYYLITHENYYISTRRSAIFQFNRHYHQNKWAILVKKQSVYYDLSLRMSIGGDL